jgi:hypothetical protein
MYNAGLLWKYKVNRRLADEERELQLKQQQRLDVDAVHQLTLVRVNSTYLEMVDKYFAHKGWLTLVMLIVILLAIVFPLRFWVGAHEMAQTVYRERVSEMYWALTAISLIFVPIAVAGVWLLRKECFRYTHYPIRLNRRSGTVYVFRLDGTVLQVPWNKLFFTIGHENTRIGRADWELVAHVLDDDQVTVRETIPFGFVADQESVRCYWEFLRRYMEVGPQAVNDVADYFMPVIDRRESFGAGFTRIVSNLHMYGASLLTHLFMLPFDLLQSCARWLCMRTCKIPAWPAAVEAACTVDPDDPYIKDASSNVSPWHWGYGKSR